MNTMRIALLLFFLGPVWSVAGGLNEAQSFLNQIQKFSALSADFVQTINDNEGTLLQETKGTLLIQRPQNIHWQTLPPYEQIVVGNDTYLWVYDPDLEQATRYSGQKVLEGPLSILMQSAESLAEQNDVSLFVQGKKEFYSLQPIDAKTESNFNELEFVFEKGKLSQIKIRDKLDQVSAITFNKVKLDPKIQKDRFEFSAPANVDLVIND
jgi:outer membrane lipoprotein carrier protein